MPRRNKLIIYGNASTAKAEPLLCTYRSSDLFSMISAGTLHGQLQRVNAVGDVQKFRSLELSQVSTEVFALDPLVASDGVAAHGTAQPI